VSLYISLQHCDKQGDSKPRGEGEWERDLPTPPPSAQLVHCISQAFHDGIARVITRISSGTMAVNDRRCEPDIGLTAEDCPCNWDSVGQPDLVRAWRSYQGSPVRYSMLAVKVRGTFGWKCAKGDKRARGTLGL